MMIIPFNLNQHKISSANVYVLLFIYDWFVFIKNVFTYI